MLGIILAAGRGERLRPITLSRSKAMAPILGKPIVERVMDSLAANGVSKFLLVISPNDSDITHYFRHKSAIPADVHFACQPEPLGMAHALACAAPFIDSEFILSACDNLVSAADVGRMLAVWHGSLRPNAVLALMTVEPEQVSKGGIVEMEGPWVTRIVEKPSPAEAQSNIYSLPLYCFSLRVLDYLSQVSLSPRGQYELQDAIQRLIELEGRVCGASIPHRLTLTSPQDLLAINRHYLTQGAGPFPFTPHAIGPGTHLIPPLCIEQGTIIGADCTIGPNVYVESGCQIGDRVTICDSVVLRGRTVPDGATVQDQVLS